MVIASYFGQNVRAINGTLKIKLLNDEDCSIIREVDLTFLSSAELFTLKCVERFLSVGTLKEVSQMVCDSDLLTGFCVLLSFPVCNFFLIHHSLQNQDETALQEMTTIFVSIVLCSINNVYELIKVK